MTYDKYMADFKANIKETANKLIHELQTKMKEANVDGYVIGMSGGLDCSTVAMLCSKANIPAFVVSLPNGASMTPTTLAHCTKLCAKAGYTLHTIDIGNECNSIITMANRHRVRDIQAGAGYNGYDIITTNVPPRVRMTYLYAFAGAKNYLVLGTSNLSELTAGYFTKWGDGASDFEPLKDLTKSEVRILAKYLGVPKEIINKAPSADLWQGQTDEDEMGITYEEMDKAIRNPEEANPEILAKVEEMKRKSRHKMVLFA